MSLYYYYLNNLIDNPWRLAYISSFCNIEKKDLNAIRKKKVKKKHLLLNGGWHFSYLGGIDNIIKKIEAFSHKEFNKDEYKNRERLLNHLNSGTDIFGRNDYRSKSVAVDESFPRYVLDNIEYYQQIGWIK